MFTTGVICVEDWPYLIFVIVFTRAKFLENKIYTEKRQFLALNLWETPIFCAKSVKKRQFFALHLKKFTPAKKNLPGYIRGIRDKLEVWAGGADLK